MVDKKLDRMSGLQRAIEAFRYTILSIEFWISPDGCIREWLRKHVRWSAIIIIPTITVFPIATFALWELSSALNALTAIAGHLICLPILMLLVLLSISIVFKIVGAFKR